MAPPNAPPVASRGSIPRTRMLPLEVSTVELPRLSGLRIEGNTLRRL